MKTLQRLLCVVASSLFFSIPPVSIAQSKNWTSLFDGKTLEGWQVLGGQAKFTVENGNIVGTTVANSPNTFLATRAEYGDFILEVDIRISDTINNSGIQTRSHFNASANGGKGRVYGRQVEVDPSSRQWTGGIYDEARRGWLYPLELNPGARKLFTLNKYNTFRIECIGNEMRTWVNGKPVAYLVDTIDQKGFIALQVHSVSDEHAGKKLYFKNIRIKTTNLTPTRPDKNIYVVNLQDNQLTDYEKNNGWQLLFDGRSNNGWTSARGGEFPAKGWKIENGQLTVISSPMAAILLPKIHSAPSIFLLHLNLHRAPIAALNIL